MTVPFLNIIIWRRNGGQKINEEKDQARAWSFQKLWKRFSWSQKSAPFLPSPRKTIWRGLG
ncbi:hypothetical protein V3595_19400 [Bacillus sp. CFBP9009]